MSSKGGGTALTRRNYRLASDTDKPRSTGIVNEKLLSDYLHHVFPPSTNQGPALASLRKPLGFQDLGAHLEKLLSEGEPAEDSRGKVTLVHTPLLGEETAYSVPVVLDHTSGFEGLLFVDDDLLGVIGHSNFSSIRATTCVYKGKWAYEVLISSQGLMQIGWCTLNCRFNQEEGVGDTPDSYAYDGNRVRKWNVTTTNYGKSWAAGDIVSCLIDLDEGTITFCLLSFKESVDPVKCVSCWLCFSLTVVTYPVEGYLPLQNPPTADLMKANKLLGFIKTVLSTSIDTQEERLLEREFTGWRLHGEPTVLITLAHIFNHFAPLMCKVYLVEDVLMNFLLGILEGGGSVDEHPLIQQLLDLFWLLMEDYEGKDEREPSDESADERLRRRAYERGCQRLKKRIEVVEELQVQILKLLLNNKDKTTGEASRYIFLNKFRKFLQENASNRGHPTALCPPEYMVCFLHRLITAVRMSWDEGRRQSEEAYVPPQLFYNGKVDYFDLQRLGGLLKANIIIDPAEIQASSMDDLDEDEESGAAQRPFGAAVGGALARPSWLSSPTLGRANRFLSTAAVSLMTPRRPLSQPEKVKVRTLAVEQRTEDDIEGSHGNDGLLLGRPMEEPEQPIADKSLLEIVDGIVMMYNLSVHQQLGKMVVVSDDVHEYAVALKDTEEKIARCPAKPVRDIHFLPSEQ
ncbi:E3 ubiquitin-protein ligase RNF123 [Dissostichus eleginoides]|uniref:E3 ubiquitin-protein ligase RNF123 n=1 Tax=Dissostichus eleginoides TaxID=100907 RepID=A0AAD9FDG6_DISEL|nr:E3 ubiquitin-protein ligase RNF123 [Dissostichus eleginoides]